MPDPDSADILLWEPALSNRAWTIHKTCFVWKLTGNAGRRFRGHRVARASAVEMRMDISQEPFCVEIYRGNA